MGLPGGGAGCPPRRRKNPAPRGAGSSFPGRRFGIQRFAAPWVLRHSAAAIASWALGSTLLVVTSQPVTF